MRSKVKPFIISFHKNIRGRERKRIKRIEEEVRERAWGKGDGFIFIMKL